MKEPSEQYEIETGKYCYDGSKIDFEYSDDYVEWLEQKLTKQVENNEVLDPVSHCPLCNSDNLHQYKLHHVHCKNCKEDFNKSCG